jgi:hypothetical protein
MGMGQQNFFDCAPGNLCCDFIDVMRGVDNGHMFIIANNPHIIIDFPSAAVERERPMGNNPFNSFSH